MRLAVIFILWITSFGAIGQTQTQLLELANQAMKAQQWMVAKQAYNRVLYFTDSPTIKVECATSLYEIESSQKDYTSALRRLKEASLYETDATKKDILVLQQVQLLILQQDIKRAKFELLQLFPDSSEPIYYDYQLLTGIIALAEERYDEAKSAFSNIMKTDADKQELEEIMQHMRKKLRKPRVAKLMSFIVPGSGQLYAGDVKNAVNSFLLVGVLGGLFASTAITYNFWTALLGVAPWFQRYYAGGIKRAGMITKARNERVRNEHLNQVLELIKKPSQ